MQEQEMEMAASAFRDVPRTGVIFVMTEAARKGYRAGDPNWTNFGQGQPEVDAIPGAPTRISEVAISPEKLKLPRKSRNSCSPLPQICANYSTKPTRGQTECHQLNQREEKP